MRYLICFIGLVVLAAAIGCGASSTNPREAAPFAHADIERWENWQAYWSDREKSERGETMRVFRFDREGVVMVDYGSEYDDAGLQYNPVTVAQYGQALYRRYLAGDGTERNELRRKFLAQADWLAANAVHRGELAVWEYHFPNPFYGVREPPWVSGMAQGEALIVLVEAHSITGDDRYLEVARRALVAFSVEVKDGGVRTTLSGDAAWYEIVAAPGAKSSRVLNGHMFALAGILEYYDYTMDEAAWSLYQKGLTSVVDQLPSYDTGSHSYYDQLGTVASEFHHCLHISQLRYFFERSGEPEINKYADLFQSYEAMPTAPETGGP